MQRWMARAAGGTSQRLKPGRATIRSRSSRPTELPIGGLAVAVVMGPPFGRAGRRSLLAGDASPRTMPPRGRFVQGRLGRGGRRYRRLLLAGDPGQERGRGG